MLFRDSYIDYDINGIPHISYFMGDTLRIQCGVIYRFYVEANGIYEWNTDISYGNVPTHGNDQLRTKITLFYDDFKTSAVVSDRAVNSTVPGSAAAGLSWRANYTGVVGIMVNRGDRYLNSEDFCACTPDTILLRFNQRRRADEDAYVVWGRYGVVRNLVCNDDNHFIYDSGTNSQLMDASGDYSNNEDGYLVLYPEDIRSKLKLWGASILDCGDTLFIYNGNIEENPNLVPIEAITGPNARYLGTEDAPLFMSAIPGEPITLRMKSDSSCTLGGLELQAKCCQNPGLPQNLHGVMTSDTTTFLTWEPGEGNELVYNWELFRASDNVMLLSGSTYSSEVMLDGLDPNESYYFTISVVSACSNDTASSEGVDVMYSNVFMMEPPAQCPEFTDLSAPGVKCQYGSFANPLQYTGIAVGRHTVITQQGSDPNTGHQLPFLPPGESAVVKLGNERTGAEAEAVTYQFTVDPDYAILLLKFAVVLEDPGHPSPDQPRFVVRVLNNDGQLVETCAEYDVTAAGNIPGFLTYSSGRRPVRWRPWTNVGIDLTDYAGQQVKLQFVTYDCDWHGHFGYAYYTASCIDNNLALAGCNGNQMTLVAPSGFESYQWDNGSTSTTATYTVNGTTSANCLITSATGCQFTLSGTLSSDPGLPTVSSTVYDTICEGDNYNQHFFNLPPQFELGTHTFRNTFFDVLRCTGGDVTTTLFLTVLPRYNHIYDAVCQGMDYNAHGFHYTSLQTGNYTDTLVTELPTGCDLIKILHLTVSPSFNMANTLTGENSVCRNEVYSYALQNAEGLGTFHWNVPAGVNILTGQCTSEVNLYFTDDAPNPAVISLMGANGCGSGSIPLSVTHYPTYHIFYQDTLCSGNEYHRYGFNLARQDSVGWFTFIDRYSTVEACDSMRILQLLVTGTPTLTTLAQPAEICIGQGTIIHTMGENAFFAYQVPPVAIGDILCTDNSIVKPSAWPVAGKTAMGIVFYVDSTGEHGWAVQLQDQGASVQWTPTGQYTDISTLTNYTNARDAITDLNGYTNTQRIRADGNATKYPAAYVVDFANGWYLPAAGQLNLLFAEIVAINASLQAVDGTQFPMDSYFSYWSSTEYGQNSAWLSGGGRNVKSSLKYVSCRARSVRAF